jgi:hypothetical protein
VPVSALTSDSGVSKKTRDVRTDAGRDQRGLPTRTLVDIVGQVVVSARQPRLGREEHAVPVDRRAREERGLGPVAGGRQDQAAADRLDRLAGCEIVRRG